MLKLRPSVLGDDVGKEDSTPVINQRSGLDEGAATEDSMAANININIIYIITERCSKVKHIKRNCACRKN